MEKSYDNAIRSKKKIFVNNFIGGIAWGLGATIGITLILAVFGYTLRNIVFVPIIGEFVQDVSNFVIQNQPDFPSSENLPQNGQNPLTN